MNLLRSIAGLLLLLPLTVSAQTPADSAAFANAKWQTTDLGHGAKSHYAQIDMFGSRQSISVARYPRKAFSTQLIHHDRKAYPTSELGQTNDAAIAVNGSYFNVKTYAPVTFVVLGGKVVGQTTEEELMRTNGIVAFRGRHGHRIDIGFCDTADYRRFARRYRSALAGGPVLVHKGEIVKYDSKNSFYARRHPRTLIGTTPDGQIVMAVIDGRFPGQGDGTTIAETAYIAQQMGLIEALNLDGGGSSTLWTAKEGVLNHPYDNGRFDHEGQRLVPNAIIAKPR